MESQSNPNLSHVIDQRLHGVTVQPCSVSLAHSSTLPFFHRWTPKARRPKPKCAMAAGVSSVWCPPLSVPTPTRTYLLLHVPFKLIYATQLNSAEVAVQQFHIRTVCFNISSFQREERACPQSQCIIQRGITSLNCNIGSNELRSASEPGRLLHLRWHIII